MNIHKKLPSQSRLKELFLYKPEDGFFVWRDTMTIAGSIVPKGYVVICIDGERYFAHRLAWKYVYGNDPVMDLDHIDTNGLNNKISNLREATNHQNHYNTTCYRNSKTQVKGVSWSKANKKWRSEIQANGVRIFLGYHSNLKTAKMAYRRAAKKYHGEFAKY